MIELRIVQPAWRCCGEVPEPSRLLFDLVDIVPATSCGSSFVQKLCLDAWGRAVPTPEPYEPVRIIYGPDLGIGELRGPEDLFVAPDQTIYIVDTRNNQIVRTTSEFEVLDIYAEFERDGVIDRFNNPLGVFVTDYGHMFVADTNNGRIVRFDENGKFVP